MHKHLLHFDILYIMYQREKKKFIPIKTKIKSRCPKVLFFHFDLALKQ